MKSQSRQTGKKARNQPTGLQPWSQMNRKQRRELQRKIQSQDLSLEVVHPDAAGIDVGNEVHYVAVPPNRSSEPVRRFGCTTAELKAMADWLQQCGIRTALAAVGTASRSANCLPNYGPPPPGWLGPANCTALLILLDSALPPEWP